MLLAYNEGMSNQGSLLQTKLHAPKGRTALISRPRLTAKLNDTLSTPLTLISAPAGFGKTSLVLEWQAQSQQPMAWLSLEADDSEPVRFLSYLVAALQTLDTNLGQNILALLQSPQTPSIKTLLAPLLSDLSQIEPSLLVLDDYHTIQDPTIHEALTYFVDHLPPQLRIILTTRADPPFTLALWRVRGQLGEIRANDLRFSREEAMAFLNSMGLNPTQADVEALDSRTEGWIAGLQLAALSMKGRSDIAGFIRSFTGSNRYIGSFLLEEVLSRQPLEVQEFLLKTSILERLSAELCNAVTGRSDGDLMIEGLASANLFLIPLDDSGNWYRYHHLFADVLQARLKQTQPATVVALHRLASDWFIQHGLADKAIKHALEIPDYELAANIIEPSAESLAARGEVAALHRWLKALPEEVIQHRISLLLYQIWISTLYNQSSQTDRWVQHTQHFMANLPPQLKQQQGELEGTLAVMMAQNEMAQQNYTGAMELARKARSLLLPASSTRGAGEMVFGHTARYTGEFAHALEAYQTAEKISRESKHFFLEHVTQHFQSMVYRLQGRLGKALELSERGKRLASSGGRPTPTAGLFYIELAWIALEQGGLEIAEGYALEVMNPQHGLLIFDGLLYDCKLILAMVRAAQGSFDQAFALTQEALQHHHELRGADPLRFLGLTKAGWALRQRNIGLADSLWKEALSKKSSTFIFVMVDDLEHLTHVRLFIAQNKPDQALTILQRFIPQLQTGGRVPRLIEALNLQAIVLDKMGKTSEALAALERSLMLGEPEGFFRTFVDEGQPLINLLQKLRLTDARLTAYRNRLIGTSATPTSEEPQSLLSSRELEVLQLIASGASNPEISEHMGISVNTLKRHINSLFGKLGVDSRTRALVMAKELGLL